MSSRNARSFTYGLLGFGAAYALTLVAAALLLRVEPLSGDLTRVGNLLENDFGHRQPVAETLPGYDTRDPAGTYTRHADVLVIGDSFSRSSRWQAHVYRQTGLAITTLDLNTPGVLQSVLDSPAFRRTPPRLVVLESAERMMYHRFGQAAGPERCWPTPAGRVSAAPAPSIAPLRARPAALSVHQVSRPGAPPFWRADLGLTQTYLFGRARHLLGVAGAPPAMMLPLRRADLFTSRRADTLLISDGDVSKRHWGEADHQRIADSLLAVQNRFQANGRTAFAFMPVPDKLSAYEPQLAGPEWRGLSRLDAWARVPGLRMVPLLAPLQALIGRGVPDVYLPNDTHWGPPGYRAGAEALLAHMHAHGLLTGPPVR